MIIWAIIPGLLVVYGQEASWAPSFHYIPIHPKSSSTTQYMFFYNLKDLAWVHSLCPCLVPPLPPMLDFCQDLYPPPGLLLPFCTQTSHFLLQFLLGAAKGSISFGFNIVWEKLWLVATENLYFVYAVRITQVVYIFTVLITLIYFVIWFPRCF